MSTTTTNYGLVKPANNETADIAVINSNIDKIDTALTPTADPALVPTANVPGKLVQWVSWLTNRLKSITGKANWWDAPATTIEALNTAMGTKAATTDLTAHKADLATHGEVLSLYRTGKDSNGVYTTLQWKRADGTLAKQSVLSGGTSPKYTTRTVTYYALNGATVALTKVYTGTYTGDDLTSEVMQ